MFESVRLRRRLAAVAVAGVGVINILSSLYPALPQRMELLRDFLTLHFIRGAQTATVLVGFCLILLADGLRKRRKRALYMTVALLLVSGVLHVLKGLDVEEASIAVGLAIGLLAIRRLFDIPGRMPLPQHLLRHVVTVATLFCAYDLAGFLILRHVIAPAPTAWGAALEPFRLLFDQPSYHYLSAQARWFERSLAFIGAAAVIYTLLQVLRPLIPHRSATCSELERVRLLVQRYGDDTLSYFALQDGRSYFFDASGEAFLSYRLSGTVALVGGDPIGPPDRFPQLIQAFLEFAEATGVEPCFLGVSGSHVHLYRALGLGTLKIGEEALIELPAFDAAALKRKVRRAVRHIAELGIVAVTYRREEIPEDLLPQMEAISHQWVKAKGGAEQGFSMTLGRLPRHTDADCEVTLAMQGDRVLGYLCMVPVYQGGGWSLDAMRRRLDSPNGLMEFLVVKAAETYRDRGQRILSLNFATLANSQNDMDSALLDGTRRFLFEHLSSFYQLKSLCEFNGKFQPCWRSRYLVYRDALKIPHLAVRIIQCEDPVRLPAPAHFFRR